jgi:hypothetical protein
MISKTRLALASAVAAMLTRKPSRCAGPFSINT